MTNMEYNFFQITLKIIKIMKKLYAEIKTKILTFSLVKDNTEQNNLIVHMWIE